jgi:purine-binding chemotaxis protein CheW
MTAYAARRDQTEDLVTTFSLGDTMFGLDAMRIQEIVQVGEVTQAHHAPDHIVGLMNLRGKIVIIIDLARRLGLHHQEILPESRVLIMEWGGEYVGLLVENHCDVLRIDPESMAPRPENVGEEQSRHIEGMYKDRGGLITLLNADTVLAEE